MQLKRNPFLHIIPLDDEYVALYNSLNLEVVFLRRGFLERYEHDGHLLITEEISEEMLKILRDHDFFIPDDSDGLDLLRGYQKALEEPAVNILYLLLSDACNIRCAYCYFLGGMPEKYHHSMMTMETARVAIELFARSVKKSRAAGHIDQQVVIYGGEPTLNKAVLIETLEHIDALKAQEALPQSLSVTLNTNGILLDEEILQQCRKSGAVVAISIDGPKYIHDKMRVRLSGEGTFDSVIRSYRLAQRVGVNLGICVTIDHHNIFHMREIVEWLGTELGAHGMGFNILIEHNGATDGAPNYADIVAHELIESFKIARVRGIYEDRMMRRVKNFMDKTPVLSDCGGCGLQVVVGPDGKIGTCQAFCGEKRFFVDEPLESFEPERHPFWKQWRRRSPLRTEKCFGCIALGNCGGGCPYNAYRLHGDINALDERFCAHAKSATLFLIGDLWEQQKNKHP
ncbi:MAG: radical SAM protein [bacterium]|nr:radical SAM protein [bacterium]